MDELRYMKWIWGLLQQSEYYYEYPEEYWEELQDGFSEYEDWFWLNTQTLDMIRKIEIK